MKQVLRVNLDKIPSLAKTISKGLKGGEIFGLVGALGAGKTTFVQALGKELKIKNKITSPTFVLLNQYKAQSGLTLYHLDLYRTKNFREVKALGIMEFLGKPKTATFIEWADKIKKHLPKKTQFIEFSGL